MSYGTVQAEKMTTESGYSLGAGNASSFKNRVINPGMVIDQRNAGAAVTVNPAGGATYVVDRWQLETSIGAYSAQRSTNAPTGFTNSFQVTVSSAGTPGASGYSNLYHWVEGFNWADMGFGTAAAKAVTLSFWVRSSITGNFTVSLVNDVVSFNNSQQYTISSANTWTFVSLTFNPPTSGSGFNTTNQRGVGIRFDLGTGTNFQTSTQNAWVSGVSAITGSAQLITNASATWFVTGVQLEVGTVATSFDFRDYGRELMMCQRYYQKQTISIGEQYAAFAGNIPAATRITFPVTMRATPTVVLTNISASTTNSAFANFISTDGFSYQVNITATGSYSRQDSASMNGAEL